MPVRRTDPHTGETREWNGQTWTPVSTAPADTSTPGLFSGGLSKLLAHPIDSATDIIHGLMNNPRETMSGFAKGAAEGAPAAAKIGQAALPLLTGGASIPAQMAIGAGGQGVVDLANAYAGNPEAPKSGGQFLEDMLIGGAIPAGLSVAGRGVAALKDPTVRKIATTVLSKAVPAAGGAMEGYKYGGVPGALAGGAGGLALGSKASKMLEGLGDSEAATAVEDAVHPSGFAQQPKSRMINRPDAPFRGPTQPAENFWPAGQTVEPRSLDVLSGGDQFAHGGEPLSVNRPGPVPSFPEFAPTPSPNAGGQLVSPTSTTPTSVATDALDSISKAPAPVDRVDAAPSVQGLTQAGKPPVSGEWYGSRPGPEFVPVGEESQFADTRQAPVSRSSDAELDNIQANAPYGEGHILPSGVLPTELRSAALQGLDQHYPAVPLESGERLAPGGPSFTDWSKGIDDIINSTTADDLAKEAGSGPKRRTDTRAWRDLWQRMKARDAAQPNP